MQKRAITTTCLINSCNYREYVTEAVDSALAQTVVPDQIVVVDDGSTDGSLDLLCSRYRGDRRVEIVSKPNGGQLSSFEAGVARATGEIVFFLDADDVWLPGYLEQVLVRYSARPEVDFVYCGLRRFGRENDNWLFGTGDRDLGYTAALTYHKFHWIGAPTSALSMRRWVVERILPIPFHDDWRIRADDCLVFGASVVGASKHYVARPLVKYRVHDRNRFYGRTWDAGMRYRRRLAIGRLLDLLCDRTGWSGDQLADAAHLEFETLQAPTLKEFKRYARIVGRTPSPISVRLKRIARMTWMMHSQRPAAQLRAARARWVDRLGLRSAEAGAARTARQIAARS